MSQGWIKACDAGEIELEDVIRFDSIRLRKANFRFIPLEG
jgi:hypothetical protein